MGDPGVPVMAGLLAVPVGVLLFVVALALMGGRQASPEPLDEPELDGEPDWEPQPEYAPSGRPAEDRALPPARPRLELPPARLRYGAYSSDVHEPEHEHEPDTPSRQAFQYGSYRHQ